MKVEFSVLKTGAQSSARAVIPLIRQRLWPESGAVSPIPSLDSLRALAIILVLLFHAWYRVPGYLSVGQQESDAPMYYGRTGVHLFFVLSGFLLFLPYARWIFGMQPRPSALLFYKRRALRVGPAYWACLVILTIAGPWTLAALGDLLLHAVFLSNVVPASIFSINGVFWTMAIEVQFYVVLPALAWVIYALSRHMHPITAAAVMMVAMALVVLASVELYNTRLGHMRLFSGILVGESALSFWIVAFSTGMLCSVVYTYLTRVAPPQAEGARRLEVSGSALFIGGAGVALLLAFAHTSHGSLVQVFFGLAYAALVFGVLFGSPLIRRVLELRAVRFLGLISYSFYLWHSVVLDLIDPSLRALPYFTHIVLRFVIGGILSVAVAYISYQLIERPFISARRKAHEITDAAPAPVASVAASA